MWGGLHVICVDVVAAAAHRTTVGISALLQHRGRQVWKRLSNNSLLMKGVYRHNYSSMYHDHYNGLYSGTAT